MLLLSQLSQAESVGTVAPSVVTINNDIIGDEMMTPSSIPSATGLVLDSKNKKPLNLLCQWKILFYR